MKITLKEFKFVDYVKFLQAKLNPRISREFSKSLIGYFIAATREVFNKKRIYKFAVYAEDSFAGFGAIYNETDFYEVGIFIFPSFRNKGIGKETIKELIKYAFAKLKMKKIRATVEETRNISNKLAKDLGFKLIKRDKKNKRFIWEMKK